MAKKFYQIVKKERTVARVHGEYDGTSYVSLLNYQIDGNPELPLKAWANYINTKFVDWFLTKRSLDIPFVYSQPVIDESAFEARLYSGDIIYTSNLEYDVYKVCSDINGAVIHFLNSGYILEDE